MPSVVFAEASWYGSLRGGMQAGGGSDAQFFDGGSRWGIKGSAEAAEGLTAVYRFETKISTTNAGQPGGRLAYVGLSGGFGSLSLGQIWNAAYNHAGAITDKSYYFGDSHTGYRHGNAVSYAFSSGALGFQLDLVSDSGMDSGSAIDKVEFGMTVGIGEMGKVAIAHTNMRDTMKEGVIEAAKPYQASVPTVVTVTPGTAATVVVGTPAEVTAGTPVSVTDGTPVSVTDGTPVSVTAGTPGSYDGGTPGTATKITGGSPYEPAEPGHTGTPQLIWHTGTILNVDGDGNLKTGDDLVTAKEDDVPVSAINVYVGVHSGEATVSSISTDPAQADDGGHYEYYNTGKYTSSLDDDGNTVLTPIIKRTLRTDLTEGVNAVNRTGTGLSAVYYIDNKCKPDSKGVVTDETCVKVPAYVNTEKEDVAATDTRGAAADDKDHQVTTVLGEGETITDTYYATITRAKGRVSIEEEPADPGKPAKAGVPVTVVDGTDGTPPSYTANIPTAVEPNIPTAVEPNIPTAVEPGTPTAVEPNTPTVVEVTPGTPSVAAVPAVMGDVTEPGYKSTHVAVEFNVGGMTPHLGYSQKKMNGSGATTKVVHYGLSGSMGDTGMSYLLAARSVKTGDDSTTPWLINVSRSLGGGATAIFGYGDGDDGNSGTSRVGLHINF